MSDDHTHHAGLTRRELEREAAWMMRHMPTDPAALAKQIVQVIIALIDKNNAAMAKHAAHHDDHKPGHP